MHAESQRVELVKSINARNRDQTGRELQLPVVLLGRAKAEQAVWERVVEEEPRRDNDSTDFTRRARGDDEELVIIVWGERFQDGPLMSPCYRIPDMYAA